MLGSPTAGSAEAEDSSYDSDYEAEESGKPEKLHPDVSRTTSDTLAAEFAEYVTVQNATPAQSPGKKITQKTHFQVLLFG